MELVVISRQQYRPDHHLLTANAIFNLFNILPKTPLDSIFCRLEIISNPSIPFIPDNLEDRRKKSQMWVWVNESVDNLRVITL